VRDQVSHPYISTGKIIILVATLTGWTIENHSWKGQGFFLFATASRPTVGTTQPLCPGGKEVGA
jgi:hypothetical protein